MVQGAQDPSSALLLQSGTVYPPSNLNEFSSTPVNNDEVIDGYYYRIIQFSEYPDAALKEKIKASGILLNNYLPYRSYNCAIPVTFDKANASALKISSVLKWDAAYKLNRKINGQDFPAHTIIEKGHADLIVHVQQNIAQERARQLLTVAGFRIIGNTAPTHSFTIRLPFEQLNSLVNLPFIYFIEPVSMPSTPDDTEGRSLHRSNIINSDYTTGRHYDGSGVVIGLADDGEIGPHIDFKGRVTQHLSGLGGNHGDMTSGICVGAGNLIPRIKGMASGAYLHVYDISGYPQINDAVNNYMNYGIVITSTSYAQNCNEYNSDSQLGDQLINQNSEFNFCFSAGNAGTTDCSYGAGNVWGNITGGFKMGKNVIAVGNLNNVDELETSSSRGPAVDGRLKPDICSNGYDQRSTDENNTYQVGGGTSAACPGVAGCLAQLYQAYKEINSVSLVPAGLIKACILNTAEDLGNPGPDFQHGYGRINSFKALKTIEQGNYFIDSVSQGQSRTHNITVPANTTELRVMIYWNDIEGAVASQKNLVNDLNLVVTRVQNGQNYLPLVLDPTPNPTNLNTDAVPGVDSLNNSEQVRINNPVAGSYEINIDGFQVPVGVQTYFIVYEFNDASVTVTYPNGGEGLVPAETELIRWDATGYTGTFDVDYSDNGGTNWNNISTGIAGTERYLSWTVPVLSKDQMLIRVTRNGLSDVSDSMFTIMKVPLNLHVTFACPDSIGLAWDPVQNATGYDVSVLGSKYMDFAGTTTATSFKVTGFDPLAEQWFSVKALGPNGGKGCRANAINQQPGLFNCSLQLDGALEISSPASGTINDCQNLGAFPVKLIISNPGQTALTNFTANYTLDNGATVTENITGPVVNGSLYNFTFAQTLTVSPGTHTVKVWIDIGGDLNHFNDTVEVVFNIVNGTAGTISVLESFTSFAVCATSMNCESTNCTIGNGWTNVANNSLDDIDWRINQGATPTTATGPASDHTTGTGKYIYLEASSCFEKEAILLSPCFDLTATLNPYLTFWLHMFGGDMGELHIDIISPDGVYSDIIPVRSGDQGDFWIKDSVSLSQFIGQTISVRFRGITGTNVESDMALDDIGLFEMPAGIEDASIDNSIRVYPNPSTGIFNYSMNSNATYDLKVIDALGNIVLAQSISGRGQINLSLFPAGVYTATIQKDKGIRQIKLMNIKE